MAIPDPETVQRAIEVKRRHEERLRALPHVSGVAVGFKHVAGKRTETVAILIHVIRKTDEVPLDERVPPEIEGVPTDVIESTFSVAADSGRYRPLIGGIEIGRVMTAGEEPYIGTLGAICYDLNTGDPLMLTNTHVVLPWLSDVPVGVGTAVAQPGNQASNQVGRVLRWTYSENADAAVMTIDDGVAVKESIVDLGDINGYVPARHALGLSVRKRGRTTGVTYGIVTAIDFFIDIRIGDTTTRFRNQIKVESDGSVFVQGGDSGSLVLTDDGRLVGLLSATSDESGGTVGIVNPIERVTEELSIGFRHSAPRWVVSTPSIRVGGLGDGRLLMDRRTLVAQPPEALAYETNKRGSAFATLPTGLQPVLPEEVENNDALWQAYNEGWGVGSWASDAHPRGYVSHDMIWRPGGGYPLHVQESRAGFYRNTAYQEATAGTPPAYRVRHSWRRSPATPWAVECTVAVRNESGSTIPRLGYRRIVGMYAPGAGFSLSYLTMRLLNARVVHGSTAYTVPVVGPQYLNVATLDGEPGAASYQYDPTGTGPGGYEWVQIGPDSLVSASIGVDFGNVAAGRTVTVRLWFGLGQTIDHAEQQIRLASGGRLYATALAFNDVSADGAPFVPWVAVGPVPVAMNTLRKRQRDDGVRRRGAARNTPTSRQASPRRGVANTYW